MSQWEDLSWRRKLLIGAAIVLAACFAPEIALLVEFGGIEVAFTFLAFYFAPLLKWCHAQLEKLTDIAICAIVAIQSSASARPKIFLTQAAFCAMAILLTGSGPFAMAFFMPGMLFNNVLI